MAKLFANSGDSDQMPPDLGLHCLPVTLLQVSQLQWVNGWMNDENFITKFTHTKCATKRRGGVQTDLHLSVPAHVLRAGCWDWFISMFVCLC